MNCAFVPSILQTLLIFCNNAIIITKHLITANLCHQSDCPAQHPIGQDFVRQENEIQVADALVPGVAVRDSVGEFRPK